MCKEPLFNLNIVMFFRKNFYYKDAIDEKLDKLITSGLLKHWITEYVDTKYIEIKDDVKGPSNLKLEHLFGIFSIWMIGLVTALLILVAEISTAKLKRSLKLDKLNF